MARKKITPEEETPKTVALEESTAADVGDMTQKDLPAGTPSGLDVAIKVLKNVDDIGFVYLDNRDVVRHPLVQKIVKAYEDYENKQSSKMRAKEHEEKTRKPRG